jgi:hypothetical protein
LKNINSKKEIEKRNEAFLKNVFGLSVNEWLEIFKNIGPPNNKFKSNWNLNNPTSSWCGGVTSSLRLSGKTPEGYIPCRNINDKGGHYYFVNQTTKEIIDLTIYQMKGEYQYDYLAYDQIFMNVYSKTMKTFMNKMNLKVNPKLFKINKSSNGVEYISKNS